MTVEQQAEKLIDEAYQYTETGSCVQENMSIRIDQDISNDYLITRFVTKAEFRDMLRKD